MKRVLYVEDDILLADMYHHKLSSGQLKTHHVTDAEAALEHMLEDTPDVLLLDVLLPEKNGLWLLKEMQVRKLTVPTIILTNLAEADFSMPDRLRRALNIRAYCIKTEITPAEVLSTVQSAIEA